MNVSLMNVSDLSIALVRMIHESGLDPVSLLDKLDEYADILSEADYQYVTNHLQLEILDIDKFIKANPSTKEITNPIFYTNSIPNDDGLMSYEIFGNSEMDRKGIFGYIDLQGYYIDPSCYKAWIQLDKNVKRVIIKDGNFIVDDNGLIVETKSGGSNGLDFLRKNISKINFRNKESKSMKRNFKVEYLELNRKKMFINKYLVIPPAYRDTNSLSSGIRGAVGVSEINKLYQQLIIIGQASKSTQEYGFDMSGDDQLRLQETLLAIYDWFCGNNNENLKEKDGMGISGKFGVLRTANMGKTSDYASRLVMSAPQLKANSPSDMMVNFDTSAIPLSAVIACFEPFVQYHAKQFFINQFIGNEQLAMLNKQKQIVQKIPKDPLIVFSDEAIKDQMHQYIHGYNNRLIPIEVPFEDGTKGYLAFKGRYRKTNDDPETIYNRRLTWLDVFYMAAVEATKNRMVLISRFPIDTRTNQFTSKVVVSSLKETEPMYVGDNFYKYYPKFQDSDIGRDTSNMFVDTCNMSNLYLKGIGGDYDGDQCAVKGVFTDEANDELKNLINDKKNFIGFGAKNLRYFDGDVVQSLYCITKILHKDKEKLINPIFN